ncbi:MAG: ATP synthase F1 subunit epsilon [Acidimicrobiia bacterium]|nr:ATP synthase F1 subunit epsilon [Acidimicrobiia bacterium]
MLHVELVSPERILYSGDAEMVVARTTDGEIAFLTGHAPFIGALGIGTVKIVGGDAGEERAAVHGGFVEVSNDRVTILSDGAELASQIDVARARAALERAEANLRSDTDDEADAALRRAKARLEATSSATSSSH